MSPDRARDPGVDRNRRPAAVQIVLSPTQADLIPTRATFEFTTTLAPNHRPHALSILADEAHAVTHTDPAAFLERRSKPQRQYAYTTRHADAIAGVIVHRKRQLENPIQPTEHPNILRATIQRLPDLLLAKHLPGQRRHQRSGKP